MQSRKHIAVEPLSLSPWLLTALFCGILAVYYATVAWNDKSAAPTPRVAVAIYGFLCVHFLRHGANRRSQMQRLYSTVASRLTGTKLFEISLCVALIGIGIAVLFPVVTRCDKNPQQQLAVSHLKQCGLAMILYMEDNDEKLPLQMRDGGIQSSLAPYRFASDEKEDIYQDPINNRPFHWREHLSGQYIRGVTNASEVMVAFSPAPSSGSLPTRAALFLDGHAQLLREELFQHRRHINPEHGNKVGMTL